MPGPTGRSVAALAVLCLAAANGASQDQHAATADLVIRNGHVYTLAWSEPASGAPSSNASGAASGWKADAEAVAGGRVLFVGTNAGAERYRGPKTRVIDAGGATVIPGLIDAHVHIAELGAVLQRVNLVGVKTEAEAVEKVAARARTTPKGEWIVGWGWDEGAWANRYPDMKLLSERVPDHPVYLKGLHSFAVWGNRLAFEKAGITATTPAPEGGEIRKGPDGQPTGILTNRATALLERAVPPPTPKQLEERIVAGLNAMAAGGYVAVHEAGAGSEEMQALERLAAAGRLPIRVYAMLSGRDRELLRAWRARGPDRDAEKMLVVHSVKFFADGALGSRGAWLLEDYSDRPGHRGAPDATFDKALAADMAKAGFQLAIHAIGDAANRDALDFFESLFAAAPATRALRHRIEHAQVLDPRDIPRFARLGIIASMQPPHAVEDKAWAQDRLGPERVRGAYAWRSLREAGARLVFSSDLPGSDYDIFYGLHSAITRRGKDLQPPGGWHPEQTMTPEEALRGYTTWAAYAAFVEDRTGVLAPGHWADITILDVDPLEADAEKLLHGHVLATIVAGKVVYE
ncbi:MAG TPA: amidohydrolase, partial [Vicinamibacteria bacterium]|nr:amidohydrolase [Vicinamibacteria bacterium]